MKQTTAGGLTQEPMDYIEAKRQALNDMLEEEAQKDVSYSAQSHEEPKTYMIC